MRGRSTERQALNSKRRQPSAKRQADSPASPASPAGPSSPAYRCPSAQVRPCNKAHQSATIRKRNTYNQEPLFGQMLMTIFVIVFMLKWSHERPLVYISLSHNVRNDPIVWIAQRKRLFFKTPFIAGVCLRVIL